MRNTLAIVAILFLCTSSIPAADVTIKGAHLCCPGCVRAAAAALKDVDGVSEVKGDAKGKTVSFTAASEKAGKAGVHALFTAGFFGKVSVDGKDVPLKLELPKGEADSVTVSDVHVCCGACRRAIGKLFPDAEISYKAGKGPQKSVTIAGKKLDKGKVLETLREAGFNGKVAK